MIRTQFRKSETGWQEKIGVLFQINSLFAKDIFMNLVQIQRMPFAIGVTTGNEDAKENGIYMKKM